MDRITLILASLILFGCNQTEVNKANISTSPKVDSLGFLFSEEKYLYDVDVNRHSTLFAFTYSKPFDTCFVFYIYKYEGLIMARFTYFPTDYYNNELPNPKSKNFSFSSKSTVITVTPTQVSIFLEKIKKIPPVVVINSQNYQYLHSPDIKLFFSDTFYSSKNIRYEYFDLIFTILEREFISVIRKQLK